MNNNDYLILSSLNDCSSTAKKCKVCSKPFSPVEKGHSAHSFLRSHVPLILKCGHTVCENCIVTSLEASKLVNCPECQEVSTCSQPVEKVLRYKIIQSEFPRNLYITGELMTHMIKRNTPTIETNLLNQFSKNEPKKEEICNECGELIAQLKCVECEDIFCELCFRSIHDAKEKRKHTPLSLNFARNTDDILSDICEPVEIKCKLHPSQFLALYCNSCLESLCPACFLTQHKEHDIITLEQKNESVESELKIASENAKPVLQRLRHNLKKLKTGSFSNACQLNVPSSSEIHQMEKMVKETSSYLHAQIQLREKKLLEDLAFHAGGHKAMVGQLLSQIRGNIKLISSMIEYASSTTSSACEKKPLNMEKLLNKLKAVPETTPCHIVVNQQESNDEGEEAKMRFKMDSDLMDKILNLMDIDFPQPKSSLALLSTQDLPEGFEVDQLTTAHSSESSSNSVSKAEAPTLGTQVPRSPSVMSVMSDSSETSVTPVAGMSEQVTVSHINNPSSFYVQRKMAQIHLQKIKAYIGPRLLQKSASAPPTVKVGQVFWCKYSIDQNWYRAKITKVLKEFKANVIYMDYGNCDVVPISQLRRCPPQIVKISPQANHCSLYDCVPSDNGIVWPSDAICTFVKLVSGQDMLAVTMQVYAVIGDEKKFCVDLHVMNDYGQVSVRETLLRSKLAHSLCNKIMPDEGSSREECNIPLESGLLKNVRTEVRVSHIESPDLFYIQKINNSNVIDELAEMLKRHYEDESSFESTIMHATDILISGIIVCKWEDNWYRGFVAEKLMEERKSDEDENIMIDILTSVSVYFVDYGFKRVVPVDNIFKLHPKFKKISAQALKCSLFGITPLRETWSPGDIQVFHKHVMGDHRPFTLTAMLQDENRHKVERVILFKKEESGEFCINKLLVDNRIAKMTSPKLTIARHTRFDNRQTKAKPARIERTHTKIRKNNAKKSQLGHRNSSTDDYGTSPPVSDLESENEEEEMEDLRKEYMHAFVTHVQNPHELYIMKYGRQQEIQLLKRKIYDMYSLDLPNTNDTEWKVSDRCIAYSEQNNLFNRACIENISEEGAEVLFIDLGAREVVPLSRLRQINPELTNVADGALRCYLSGIESPDTVTQSWPDFVSNKLKNIVEENSNRLYILRSGAVGDRGLPIHLWVKKIKVAGPLSPSVTTWICINKLLVSEACAKSDHSEFTGKHFDSVYTSDSLANDDVPVKYLTSKTSNEATGSQTTSLEQIVLPKAVSSARFAGYQPAEPLRLMTNTILPTNVDYKSCIYFLHPDKLQDADSIRIGLAAKYSDSTSGVSNLFWRKNQGCTVQYHADKNWYRGIITEILDNGYYKVFFVDYGNTETVTPSELRKEVCFPDLPVLALRCSFYGLEPSERDEDNSYRVDLLDHIHENIVDVPHDAVFSEPLTEGGPYLIHQLKRADNGEDTIKKLLDRNVLKESDNIHPDTSTSPSGQCSPDVSFEINGTVDLSTHEDDADCNELLAELDSEIGDNLEALSIAGVPTPCDSDSEDEQVKPIGSWYEACESERLEQNALDHSFSSLSIPDSCSLVRVKITSIVTVSPYVSLNVNILGPADLEMSPMVDRHQELLDTIQTEALLQPQIKCPLPKMKCIAYVHDEDHDGSWHRAEILAVNEESSTVQINVVDTGSPCDVACDNIRALKPEWTLLPAQATLCILHGIELSSDENESDVLTEFCDIISNNGRDQEFFMKIRKYTPSGSLSVEIYEDSEATVLIYQPLVERGTFLLDAE